MRGKNVFSQLLHKTSGREGLTMSIQCHVGHVAELPQRYHAHLGQQLAWECGSCWNPHALWPSSPRSSPTNTTETDQNMNPDFLLAGACEQARLIARGQLSSEALMAAQYAAIAERNPSIRALIAQAPLQPLSGHSALAGTSFGAKDNIDVAGLPTAGGLRALQRWATADAPMVARLRAAGLHCVGKLNMHPLALGATNHNPDYGDCVHPQHPGHTAGGSSGGLAAFKFS
jgi:hypothetical protein